jgi:dienelactone hydrolase
VIQRGRMNCAGWGEALAKGAIVQRPLLALARVPVVLQFHGCGGAEPFMQTYGRTATDLGVAAVTIDSFRPRGMSNLDGKLFVCTGTTLRGAQRAADVFAMLAWARAQPWADPDRIALAGWSHGGWTIMDALAMGGNAARVTGLPDADPAALRAVKGAFLVYPYASFPSLTSAQGWPGARPPVTAILGGKDQVVGVNGPQKALQRLTRDGVSVETTLFPDATHAFDDDHANDPRAKYRPDLLETSRGLYAGMLKRVFS